MHISLTLFPINTRGPNKLNLFGDWSIADGFSEAGLYKSLSPPKLLNFITEIGYSTGLKVVSIKSSLILPGSILKFLNILLPCPIYQLPKRCLEQQADRRLASRTWRTLCLGYLESTCHWYTEKARMRLLGFRKRSLRRRMTLVRSLGEPKHSQDRNTIEFLQTLPPNLEALVLFNSIKTPGLARSSQ